MVAQLLQWYDAHGRDLPWRTKSGTPDPYHVWLSEVMLQQTTVATVKGYFQKFLTRWPAVADLAGATLDEVLHAWAGLGYYARARNLHKCACTVAMEWEGSFPTTYEALIKLPGIGPYTAAAIASIAFGQSETVVDGNVERVISRLFAIKTPLPKSRPEIRARAATLTPQKRPGDYAQALMDLGATVCTPKTPKCEICPWQQKCVAFQQEMHLELPRKEAKKEKPVRRAYVYWLEDGAGRVLIRRRAEKGLLGGMIEFPSSDWKNHTEFDQRVALEQAPTDTDWHKVAGKIRHTFTHFHLDMEVFKATAPINPQSGFWCATDKLHDHALPTTMKKVLIHAQAA